MIIGVDVDNVVCDLNHSWLAAYNKEYNDNLRHEDITAWDVSQFVKPECGKKAFSYFNRPELYDNMKEIPDSLKCINILKEQGHNILFITACMPKTMEAKYEWLMKHKYINSIEEFIVTDHKELINISVLLDDKPETIKNFPRRGVIFTCPWNTDYILDRVNSWIEFLDYINIYDQNPMNKWVR